MEMEIRYNSATGMWEIISPAIPGYYGSLTHYVPVEAAPWGRNTPLPEEVLEYLDQIAFMPAKNAKGPNYDRMVPVFDPDPRNSKLLLDECQRCGRDERSCCCQECNRCDGSRPSYELDPETGLCDECGETP
jgi:hypothetical protein